MPSTDCLWTEGSGAKTMSCRHYIAVIQHDFMTCHVVYHDGSWMMLFQELHGLPTGQHLRVCRPASSFDICWAFGRDGRRGRGGQNDVDDMQLFSFMNIFSIYTLYWRSHRHDIIWEPQISKNYQNPPTNKTFRKKTSFHLTRLAGPFLLTAVTSTCLSAHDIQLSFSTSEHILVPYIGHELVL